jgi:Tfp pilus assembly protein PilO
MRNIYKIIIIAVVFIVSVFLLLVVIRPSLVRSSSHLVSIAEEEERNSGLNSELDSYLEDRDDYYILNAEYQKLVMELPEKDDTLILTNELYEIAGYTGIEINSISFSEVSIDEKELRNAPAKEISINIIMEGSYYQTLNFINTIEIMPRIIKVEDISIQSPSDDYNNLVTFLSARTYFVNEYYRN